MNTRYLEEFILFSKELNYSIAAKKLFITRPTLTEHLTEIEREISCQLIGKNQGKTVLTPAGKRFVQTATELLTEVQHVVDEYQHLEDNLLSINVASTNLPWLETILHKARRNIQEQHPGKQIEIMTVNGPLSTVDALENQINDLVVTGHKSFVPSQDRLALPEGVQGFTLQTEEIKLLMTQSNPLFLKESIEAKDLDGATIMLPPDIYEGYRRDGVEQKLAERGAHITLQTANFTDHFEYFTYDFGTMIGVVPTTLIPRFGIGESEEYRVFSLLDMPFYTDFLVAYKDEFVQNENGHLLIEEMKRLVMCAVDSTKKTSDV